MTEGNTDYWMDDTPGFNPDISNCMLYQSKVISYFNFDMTKFNCI